MDCNQFALLMAICALSLCRFGLPPSLASASKLDAVGFLDLAVASFDHSEEGRPSLMTLQALGSTLR